MIQVIDATFEDGVLKPTLPLSLSPHTPVRLTVEYANDVDWSSDAAKAKRMAALASLEELWKNSKFCSTEPHLTRDELHERR